jgi:tryptophan synthase beta chain
MGRDKIESSGDELPKKWYNILSDLPEPLPPYISIRDGSEMRRLPNVFTKTASDLEFSSKRWIDIPEEVRSAYLLSGRPRPLVRAHKLESYLKTPARIYYKCEDLSPVGSFKTNTALPQAYWAMKEGYERTVFASSLQTRTHFVHAHAARCFGLTPTIFIPGKYLNDNREQANFLKSMIGAEIVESPSTRTGYGRRSMGSIEDLNPIEVAREEAVEEITQNNASIGVVSSFLNHVLLTQTIMGLEAERQMKFVEDDADVYIASVGGGSSFFGLIAPFMGRCLKGGLKGARFLAVESETTSKLTDGSYKYVQMQSPMSSILGKTYEVIKAPRHTIAGVGIQTSNTAPILGLLRNLGYIQTVVYPSDEKIVFEAARVFLSTEASLIAPESAYAVAAAIEEAKKAKNAGDERVILLSISAKSYMDFGEKQRYLHHKGD